MRGYGSKNKSSEAELLFQFFRFYAHEFDYDKYVLSVRLGKMMPKSDKNWQFAVNNQLCVEEPFNLGRNLGNTVDEYSFKGLHMELRRAFDLISAARFEEACDAYVFPKEEERVWTRPPPQPRPALLRSASQTHSGSGRGGRGGHRGGRHNNHHRGGTGGVNSNRRPSSTIHAYDNNIFAPVNIQQDLSWYPNPHFAMQYSQEILAHMAFQQQESYRHLQMYAQPSAFGQQQGMGQPMMTSSSTSGQGQSSDRSRTNSFDNQPQMAQLRPDLFALYGMTLGSPLFSQAGTAYGAYPNSPAASNSNGTGQDYRRPLQRSTVTTDKGAPASSSSLRSQSQPAARSPSTTQPTLSGQPLPISQSATTVPNIGARNPNGVPIPSFISDDADFDETPKASSMSPQSEEGKLAAYFSESPSKGRAGQQQLQPAANGIAFGDLANQSSSSSPGRRRLSTDQLPQTILDRRMRRTSRSPSPLGHSRAFSAGTASAPASAAPLPGSGAQSRNTSRPLVVNGSGLKASMSAASRLSPPDELSSGEASALAVDHASQVQPTHAQQPQPTDHGLSTPLDYPPLIVNGSHANSAASSDDQSFRERIAMLSSRYMPANYLAQDSTFAGNGRLTPSARQHLVSYQPQNAVIAPLDLAISNSHVRKPTEPEGSLLSPVYESLAPSPTTARKPELPSKADKGSQTQEPKQSAWAAAVRQNLKLDDQGQGSQEATKQPKNAKSVAQPPKLNGTRENGHIRGARSESDGGWQKAGKGKKKGMSTTQQGQAEPPPKHISERKGG